VVRLGIDDRQVALASYDNPHLFSVRREKRVVRGAADVVRVLQRIRRGIDECDGIGANRDDSDPAMVRRESHAVYEKLTAIEWAQVSRCRVAQSNDPKKLVVGGIRYRNRVGKLFSRVYAVAMADGYVRR